MRALARCSSIETQNSVSIVLKPHAAWYNHLQFLSTHSLFCHAILVWDINCRKLFNWIFLFHSLYSFPPFSHDLCQMLSWHRFSYDSACLLHVIDEQRHGTQAHSHFARVHGHGIRNCCSWKVLKIFSKAHGNYIMGAFSSGLYGHMSWCLDECLFIYLFILDQWFSIKGVGSAVNSWDNSWLNKQTNKQISCTETSITLGGKDSLGFYIEP